MSTDAIEQAEHTADRIRYELFQTLEELDRRRELALDFKYQAREHSRLLAGIGAALAALVGAKVLFSQLQRRRREKYLDVERRRGLKRAWEHPERLAIQTRRSRTFAMGSTLLTAAGSAVTSLLVRQLMRKVIG